MLVVGCFQCPILGLALVMHFYFTSVRGLAPAAVRSQALLIFMVQGRLGGFGVGGAQGVEFAGWRIFLDGVIPFRENFSKLLAQRPWRWPRMDTDRKRRGGG